MNQHNKPVLLLEYLMKNIDRMKADINDFNYCILTESFEDGSESIDVYFRDDVIESDVIQKLLKQRDHISKAPLSKIVDAVRDYEIESDTDCYEIHTAQYINDRGVSITQYGMRAVPLKEIEEIIHSGRAHDVQFLRNFTFDDYRHYLRKNFKKFTR